MRSDSTDRFGAVRNRVGEEQVRDLDALDLAAALRRVPGVSITRWNPIGSFGGGSGGAVFIRGQGTSRPGGEIKTLVDGVPLYMGVWNHPLLDLLPINAMESADVLKGPQPQHVGNAFGAISLNSRPATRVGLHGDLSIASGSFNTLVEQANASWRNRRLGIAAAQSFSQSDGHRSKANGRLANSLLRADYVLTSALRATFTGLVVKNSAGDPGVLGQPGSSLGRYDSRGSLLSVAFNHTTGTVTRGTRGMLQIYQSGGHGDAIGQPAPDGDTFTAFTLRGLRFREELMLWAQGGIAAGVDVDEVNGRVNFERVAPARASSFKAPVLRLLQPHVAVTNDFSLDEEWQLSPSAGARAYVHNTFSRAIAPYAGLVLSHGPDLSLRARWARGINYPGIEVAALSALVPALGQSWRQLAPETMGHTEVGISMGRGLSGGRISLDAAMFLDDVRDRYVFAFPPISIPPSFRNLGNFQLRGLETALRVDAGHGLAFFGAGTWLDRSLKSLPNAPIRMLSGGAVWDSRYARVSLDATGQTEMYVNARGRAAGTQNTARVDGFTIVHARMAVPVRFIQESTELCVSAENLLNRRYEYVPGYPMPMRWFTIGARAAF